MAEALSFDIAAWFQPTTANFFSCVSKAQILKTLQEAKGISPAPAWLGLKKAELATLAEREIAGTGWMPEALRAVGVSTDPLQQVA